MGLMRLLREIGRWVTVVVGALLALYCFLNACELEPHFGTAAFLRELFGLVGMD
jgi:hypothetical protein